MSKSFLLYAATVAVALGAATFIVTSESRLPKQVEVVDPVFGDYQHLYGVRLPDGKIVPWMSSLKDKGTITDFGGHVVSPRPLDGHPGCLIMDAFYGGNHEDVGFKWRDKDGDASISSRSEDQHLIACRDAVPEFDAVVDN